MVAPGQADTESPLWYQQDCTELRNNPVPEECSPIQRCARCFDGPPYPRDLKGVDPDVERYVTPDLTPVRVQHKRSACYPRTTDQ